MREASVDHEGSIAAPDRTGSTPCPECGASLLHQNGCVRCPQCGFSPCE